MEISTPIHPIRRPPHESEHSRPTLCPPRHRCLRRHLPGGSEGVAMEGLMLEILSSLCQTGTHIYGMALATIGVYTLAFIALLAWMIKEFSK